MQTSIIQKRLASYRQWKARVARAVLELESWLGAEGQVTEAAHERIRRTLQALRDDRLTIAFVAEFSRGKTELINAIFFADYRRRLLPSAAGRTTLCPTELLWDDERNEAYLRLLPIESRARDMPISQVKADPMQWVHYPLHVQDPEQISATLRELSQTKRVPIEEATRLGLSAFATSPDGRVDATEVDIPKWRHAIISFPHQLLKQGLVVLDTPGLSALGSEPELTVSTLPAAQALLFVLAADTGVTRSDLEMWQHHLKGFRSGRQQGITVALNKIDVLWDELQEAKVNAAEIARQRADTAGTLGIDEDMVFPVSAQKGLLAKIRNDDRLLEESALPALEGHISTRMLESKHRLLLETLDAGVGGLLDEHRGRLTTQINQIKTQLADLEELRGKSDTVIGHLLDKTRQEQEVYVKGVHQFQASREKLIAESAVSLRILDQRFVGDLIEAADRAMTQSWTTPGLSMAMRKLFDELRRVMQTVDRECARIRALVEDTYRRFEGDFGFNVTPPEVFIANPFCVELDLLYQDMEAFRRSPNMAFSERGAVLKRFRRQLLSRASALFEQLRLAFDAWLQDALHPLAAQIQEHKQIMERRLENLQRIGHSKDGLQKRIDELRKLYVELAKQLTALRNIHNALRYNPLVDEHRTGKPHLVAGKA